jgi:transposase
MAHLRVKRPGPGRARTRPDRVRGDKAYSSRAIRTELRRRGITTVIPEPSDQIAHRKRRGPRGGRPPAFDAADYKWRNVIERGFNSVKQWRGLATATTNSPSPTAPPSSSAPSPSGQPIYQTRPSPSGEAPSCGTGARLPVRSLFGARRRSAPWTVGVPRANAGFRRTHAGHNRCRASKAITQRHLRFHRRPIQRSPTQGWCTSERQP